MSIETTQAGRAGINVTPLIDILLVLLVIFMIVTPQRTLGLEARVPQPPGDVAAPAAPANPLVIGIGRDLRFTLNTQPLPPGTLGGRLAEVFRLRADRSVFVTADADVEFRHVAGAIDVAKGAGSERVGLLGTLPR